MPRWSSKAPHSVVQQSPMGYTTSSNRTCPNMSAITNPLSSPSRCLYSKRRRPFTFCSVPSAAGNRHLQPVSMLSLHRARRELPHLRRGTRSAGVSAATTRQLTAHACPRRPKLAAVLARIVSGRRHLHAPCSMRAAFVPSRHKTCHSRRNR